MPSTLYNPDGTRTGLRINARSRRTYHMGGEPRGGLFTEPTKSEKWAMHERARARRDAAASMPSTAASATPAKPQAAASMPSTAASATPAKPQAAASMPSTAASATPAKPQAADGMLVPGPSGSAVWRTKAQLAKEAEARAALLRKQAGGTDFVGPMPSREMVQKKKIQDRNHSRARVAGERNGGGVLSGSDDAWYREHFRLKGELDQRDPEVERILAR